MYYKIINYQLLHNFNSNIMLFDLVEIIAITCINGIHGTRFYVYFILRLRLRVYVLSLLLNGYPSDY